MTALTASVTIKACKLGVNRIPRSALPEGAFVNLQ